MKSVRITIGVVLLLMSLMFFSCASSSGKRQPSEVKAETTKRVVKLLGESYVMSRDIDTSYVPGDTVRLLVNTSITSHMVLAVVVR